MNDSSCIPNEKKNIFHLQLGEENPVKSKLVQNLELFFHFHNKKHS